MHGDSTLINAVIDRAGEVEVMLVTGDLTHFQGAKEARTLLSQARRRLKHVWAVPGNCDLPEVLHWLEEEGLSLHGCHKTLHGVAFLGAGKSLPSWGNTPNEVSEDGAFASILDRAIAGIEQHTPRVLVTHQPPFGTRNDLVGPGKHRGSQAIRHFIERHQPLASFCGHIHEAQGVDRIGFTQVVNPGPLREGNFAWAEIQDGTLRVEIRSVHEKRQDRCVLSCLIM